MPEKLITFETAKLAKEKGFKFEKNLNDSFVYDEGYHIYCFHMSNESKRIVIPIWWLDWNHNGDQYLRHDDIDAPTQSLLQKWLRETHNIDVIIGVVITGKGKKYHIDFYVNDVFSSDPSITDTYEEALEIGLFEGLELIKY